MSFSVRIKKSAEKEFTRLPEENKKKVSEAILSLEINPRPNNSKKLRQRPEFRIRVGDYRIIYEIDEKQRIVTVSIIGHRKEVYRR